VRISLAWADAPGAQTMAARPSASDNRSVRRRVIPVIVVALAAAPVASAHVTLTPTEIAPGTDAVVTVVVPNETRSDVIRGVTVTVPRAFEVDGVEAAAGFQRVGQRTEWRGTIAPGDFAGFSFAGSAGEATSALRFHVVVRYAGGRTEGYAPALAVAKPSTTDKSTRTLARAGLIAAIAAGVFAVGAFFFALANWLRGSGEPVPDDELQEEKQDSVLASRE
jgi:hypothetical protein